MAEVGLAEAIGQLRRDLFEAAREGWNEPMAFKLSPVELTLQVVVSKDANAKVGWQVLGVGGSVNKAETQTLVLRLEPVWRTGPGAYTTDFTIADEAASRPPASGSSLDS